MFRKMVVLLLAIGSVGAALVFQSRSPLPHREIWLAINSLPWVGVLFGSWIRDDATAQRGATAGTLVELASLFAYLGELAVAAGAFDASRLGADVGFVEGSIGIGCVLGPGSLYAVSGRPRPLRCTLWDGSCRRCRECRGGSPPRASSARSRSS